MKVITAVLIGILLWMYTASGTLANACARFPTLNSDRDITGDIAFAIGWSALPPAWIIAPFATGFYYDGHIWSKQQCLALKQRGNQ